MIELPEACVLADQLKETVLGRNIISVNMNSSPHKFAFYARDPENYISYLKGKIFDSTISYDGMVELESQDYRMVFSDGINLRYHEKGSEEFDEDYFADLIRADDVQKFSLKAFLATEQRIPGLGNGVLQDILWTSKLHPKRKVKTLLQEEKVALLHNIKGILKLMASMGGRDTEKDLFGQRGDYVTRISKLHATEGCPTCGCGISKEAYMGGSIYVRYNPFELYLTVLI